MLLLVTGALGLPARDVVAGEFGEWHEHPDFPGRIFYRTRYRLLNSERVRKNKPPHDWCVEFKHAYPVPTAVSWKLTEYEVTTKPPHTGEWATEWQRDTLEPGVAHESCIHFLSTPEGGVIRVWFELDRPKGDAPVGDGSGPGTAGSSGTAREGDGSQRRRDAARAQEDAEQQRANQEEARRQALERAEMQRRIDAKNEELRQLQQKADAQRLQQEREAAQRQQREREDAQRRRDATTEQERRNNEWAERQERINEAQRAERAEREETQRKVDALQEQNRQETQAYADQSAREMANMYANMDEGSQQVTAAVFAVGLGIAAVGGCMYAWFAPLDESAPAGGESDPYLPRTLCTAGTAVLGGIATLTSLGLHLGGDTVYTSDGSVWFDPKSALGGVGEFGTEFLSFRFSSGWESLSLDGRDVSGLAAEVGGRLFWANLFARFSLRWADFGGESRLAAPVALGATLQPFVGTLFSPYIGGLLSHTQSEMTPGSHPRVDSDGNYTSDRDPMQGVIGNTFMFRNMWSKRSSTDPTSLLANDLFVDVRYVFGGDGDLPDGWFLSAGVNFHLAGPGDVRRVWIPRPEPVDTGNDSYGQGFDRGAPPPVAGASGATDESSTQGQAYVQRVAEAAERAGPGAPSSPDAEPTAPPAAQRHLQLGIRVVDLTPDVASKAGLSRPQGAQAVELAPGAVGRRVGIQAFDLILKVDGVTAPNAAGLRDLLRAAGGRSVNLILLRRGAPCTLRFALPVFAAAEPLPGPADAAPDEAAALTSAGVWL